jgi:hypothetical protein
VVAELLLAKEIATKERMKRNTMGETFTVQYIQPIIKVLSPKKK